MQACASLQVDIISLDLSHRLPFRLRPKVLAPAVQRGVMFEISYACCLRDETSRRLLFSNATALARATRGQNIIVSSGARTAFELRSPYDAMNLSALFGLPERHAKASAYMLALLSQALAVCTCCRYFFQLLAGFGPNTPHHCLSFEQFMHC